MFINFAFRQFCKRAGILLLLMFGIGTNFSLLLAQTSQARLHGDVTDPTGAVIPGASVLAKSSNGKTSAAKTNGAGTYEFKNLTPGEYIVTVQAENFSAATQKVK